MIEPLMEMVETHSHLDMEPFSADREEAIMRARDAGVKTIVTIGIDLEASKRAVEIAESHDGVYATIGFHPQDSESLREEDILELTRLAKSKKVVAVGEIGLDFFRESAPRDVQFRVLERQLRFAAEMGLPVSVHCRDGETDMIRVLDAWLAGSPCKLPQGPGVIHCFRGSMEGLQHYLAMGFHIAFGAYVGYPSSKNQYDVIRSVPDDRLLTETDSPFLPPQKYRGQRNEPAYIPMVVQALADIRGSTMEDIARQTTANAKRLFGFRRAG